MSKPFKSGDLLRHLTLAHHFDAVGNDGLAKETGLVSSGICSLTIICHLIDVTMENRFIAH